jgi:hypothetical protein
MDEQNPRAGLYQRLTRKKKTKREQSDSAGEKREAAARQRGEMIWATSRQTKSVWTCRRSVVARRLDPQERLSFCSRRFRRIRSESHRLSSGCSGPSRHPVPGFVRSCRRMQGRSHGGHGPLGSRRISPRSWTSTAISSIERQNTACWLNSPGCLLHHGIMKSQGAIRECRADTAERRVRLGSTSDRTLRPWLPRAIATCCHGPPS